MCRKDVECIPDTTGGELFAGGRVGTFRLVEVLRYLGRKLYDSVSICFPKTGEIMQSYYTWITSNNCIHALAPEQSTHVYPLPNPNLLCSRREVEIHPGRAITVRLNGPQHLRARARVTLEMFDRHLLRFVPLSLGSPYTRFGTELDLGRLLDRTSDCKPDGVVA